MGKWKGEMTRENGKEKKDEITSIDPELEEMLRTALRKPTHKSAAKGIPLELLITLRKKRLPIKAIARIVKCRPANVRARLKGIEGLDTLDEWKKNRADVLSYHQRRVLESISERDLNDAGLKDKSISFGILYDKERLETGKGLGEGNIKVLVVNYSGGKDGEATEVVSRGVE